MGTEEGYRAPAVGSADAEAEALAELSRRAGRVRLMVFGPIVLIGVALVVPAYLAAQAIQWALFEVAWTAVNGAAGAAPLMLGIYLGRMATERILRSRVPSMKTELAQRYGISEETVEDFARMFID